MCCIYIAVFRIAAKKVDGYYMVEAFGFKRHILNICYCFMMHTTAL